VFIDFNPDAPIDVMFISQRDNIAQPNQYGQLVPLTLRGVEIVPSFPGNLAWDFAATYDDYHRWFEQISEMNANSIYVSTIMDAAFYRAFYDFNRTNEQPLFLLQGVSGYDHSSLSNSLREAIDIIHGNRINFLNRDGIEVFMSNISPWVVGLVVGSEWDADLVTFMNHFDPNMPDYFEGEFFSSAYGASRFEVLLAQIMDGAVTYETRRYKAQRPIGFISNPSIDFLDYYWMYAMQLRKYVELDHENIIASEDARAGMFAAYRLFYFTDDFSTRLSQEQKDEIAPILSTLNYGCFMDGYLDLLNRYHSMPVIATGFGVSSSRAPRLMDTVPLTEREQGIGIAEMAMQIEQAGWGGAFISTWQDSWERRTWNTIFSSDPWRYHYWHNLQGIDQAYGLMAFDPGLYSRPVVLDGTVNGWFESQFVHEYQGIKIYAQYTPQGLYLMLYGEGVNPHNTLYVPLDIMPHSGTFTFNDRTFERSANFMLVISGTHNTRLLTTQRNNAMFQRFALDIHNINPYIRIPSQWGSEFEPIIVATQNTYIIDSSDFLRLSEEGHELRHMRYAVTGSLTHGIGDPSSPNFNSLADFAFGENVVEVRIPWMLLNFYDPSQMYVHDDYFEHFGVEAIRISEMYIGIAARNEYVAPMSPVPLQGWRNTVEFHERLKQSYFIIQEMWGR